MVIVPLADFFTTGENIDFEYQLPENDTLNKALLGPLFQKKNQVTAFHWLLYNIDDAHIVK